MKNFHVHVTVKNLQESINFYNNLFDVKPTLTKDDYAKWMLSDPRVNFAISSRGDNLGLNHLGFQAENDEELSQLKELAIQADEEGVLDQGETHCCYAKSEKHWAVDPTGIAWEHFQSLETDSEFDQNSAEGEDDCCVLLHSKSGDQDAPCCVPNETRPVGQACCG